MIPRAFVTEMEYLRENNVKLSPENLKISSQCSVITSYDKLLEKGRESLEEKRIGTTGKGIGPAYEDKIGRKGIKLKDLLDKKSLVKKIKSNMEEKVTLFNHLYKIDYPSPEEEAEELFHMGQKTAPFLTDTFELLHRSIEQNRKILYEGAQGVLLDIDYGVYPFVTSSNTTLGGIYTGAIPLLRPKKILGITKAYMTRVGLGPFPTEFLNEQGEYIQQKGLEFGATTGRKRRCGHLDLPLLKYAVKASSITNLALTKLDILSGVDPLYVCHAYRYNDNIIDCAYPGLDLRKVSPILKKMVPFKNCIDDAGKMSPGLDFYIKTIEEFTGLSVDLLSFGPERESVCLLNKEIG